MALAVHLSAAMLVISRRKGQRITIGDDIEIVVTAVHKNGVKIGIDAPRGLAVLRGEVRDAIFSANVEATKSGAELPAGIVSAVPAAGTRAPLPAAKLALGRQSTDAVASQSGDGRPSPAAPADDRVRRSVRPSAVPSAAAPVSPVKPEAP
jgi:carbon storage regulator